MFLGSGPMSLVGVQTAEWLEGRYGDGVESTSARLPDRSLRVALATVLLASGVRLLETPAYDVWVPLILAAAAVLAAVVEVNRLNGRVARTDPA
jgi:hypothetical protein